MDPIQAAIDEIESREQGEDFSYTEVATRYGINRSTLSRRHREQELVRYIKGLTERHIPPTREMIQNFASAIAKELIVGIDSNYYNADLVDKYYYFFNLLYSCLIGIISRLKRIFSRQINRAWITLLACIYANRLALPLSLIYEAANKGI
ncbi:hypothetical protein BU23DRAFT_581885 [Bimuria novae-zelandiae CBS 107.79]|uniref:HTH CENPB-type domain-containing protein n=1 Tax=Bimuria novae-zelandiae CBS 107.79 TaxID=1447943 RepID=A0A6A5UZZ7_9PLEO|nr:hypothetical protein BU23DRAFT_581885 [Bimuria novae-zelandiae CBS 107.79]